MAGGVSVLVVGAGIFGVAGALELRRRGYEVRLIDPGPIPHPRAASTDVSKAIRMDYGSDDFYMDLMERAFVGWDAWNRTWHTPPYRQDGMVFLTRAPMRPQTFEYESFERLRARGYAPRRLDGKLLRSWFPLWSSTRWTDGYFNPRAGWADSAAVVARLVAEAKDLGVRVQEGTSMARALSHGDRVVGIETTAAEKLPAEFVMVAAGVWSPTLVPQLERMLSVVGQPIVYLRPERPQEYRAPRFVTWAADVSDTGWYGFPATVDGRVKIANHGIGVPLRPDDDRVVSSERVAKCRAFLANNLPELAKAPVVATRLCVYTDSSDGSFYIDHVPGRPGLFVATGGSGHAFKFAPYLGPLIADALERKSNPYLTRFAWREPGTAQKEHARASRRPAGGNEPSACE